MDPLVAATFATVIGNLASSAAIAAGRMLGALDSNQPTESSPAILLGDDSALTASLADADILRSLLNTRYVATLSEAYVFAKVLGRVHGDRSAEETFVSDLRDAFCEYGATQIRGVADSDALLRYLWGNLASRLDSVSDAPSLLEILDEDELRRLASLDIAAGQRSRNELKAPRFLRDLAALLRDSKALDEAFSHGFDIKSAYAQMCAEMRIDHTLDNGRRDGRVRFAFDSLYISRSAQDAAGHLTGTDGMLESPRRARVVVTGDPGAGKSTLMQHVVRQVATGDDSRVPMLVRIREFGSDRPILIEEIVAAIRRDLQLHDVSVTDVQAILTLGRGTVLFDGLDEASDVARRRLVAAAIDAFERRFPLTRILVTSRSVGYEQAPLGSAFEILTLVEFDDAQVMEYARRWLQQNGGREGDAEIFYAELESIPDLRSNPLMLSLICTLYRARGHVPRNRRQVYFECADLLFNRWDPMRQIDQPIDQVQHGQDLMQEIALWYFNSQSAQKGVESRQIEGIVEHFFRDTAGVLPSEAGRRAHSFIEYCSDRAWLLTWVSKNEHGEKLYTFTHRTFMEYFAAEGLARTSSDTRVLVSHILVAYRENASSVVPELIVQSAEFARRGLGREVLRGIAEYEAGLGSRHRGIYLALRVRLAAVLTLPASYVEPLFKECLEALVDNSPESSAILSEMMRLPRDQRTRLIAQLAGDPEIERPIGVTELRITWATAFLECWAREVLAQRAGASLHREWTVQLVDLWKALNADDTFSPGAAARLFFWQAGVDDRPLVPDELAAYLNLGAGDRTPGKVLRAIRALADGDPSSTDRASVLAQIPELAGEGSFWAADGMDYVRDLDGVADEVNPEDLLEGVRRGIAVLSMVVMESGSDSADDVAESLSRLAGFDLVGAAAARSPRVRKRAEILEAAFTEMERRGLPQWSREWAKGRLHLIFADPNLR